MIRRLLGPIPEWAQPRHPLLRYELSRMQPQVSPRARVLRILGWVLGLAALALGGYIYATDLLRAPAGVNLPDALWRTLFYPVLILQVLMGVLALSIGVGTVNEERRRQTWDNLRATELGAEMALRTRWVSIFYRLRGLLLTVMAARVVLAVGMLYQLTSHRGGYLDVLTANITPEVPLAAGILLLSAQMTAAFLLPLTGLGVDIALGLLISSAVRQRTAAAILQILVILGRLVITALLLLGATRFLLADLQLADGVSWLLMTAYSALVDWGLLLMHLGEAGEIWAIVPFGVFIGVALLGFALLQAVIADLILALAVRRAERTE